SGDFLAKVFGQEAAEDTAGEHVVGHLVVYVLNFLKGRGLTVVYCLREVAVVGVAGLGLLAIGVNAGTGVFVGIALVGGAAAATTAGDFVQGTFNGLFGTGTIGFHRVINLFAGHLFFGVGA